MFGELSIVNYDSKSTFLADYNTQANQSRPKRKLQIISRSEHVEKPKKTRKSHTKSRTGCLTCRTRRKKCDETKPVCLQCSSTGRKCDGYAVKDVQKSVPDSVIRALPVKGCTKRTVSHANTDDLTESHEIHSDSGYGTPADAEHAEEEQLQDFILSYSQQTAGRNIVQVDTARSPQKDQPRSATQTGLHQALTTINRQPDMLTGGHSYNDIDSHCFSFFRHRTGPKFTSYFESTLWKNYLIRGAMAHPVLFDAAAAVGAAHRRFEYGISREAFEYCAHAARLHAKAIRGVQDLKKQISERSSGTPNSMSPISSYETDISLAAETLLGLFQGFQGNFTQSVSHMSNALGILFNRPMTLTHRESRFYEVKASPAMFHRLFDRMANCATKVFDLPLRILVWGDDNLPSIPARFESLDQARDFLFTEVDWMLKAPDRIWSGQKKDDSQNIHVSRLLRWGIAYAELVVDMQRTRQQNNACKLLKMTRNVAYLLLYMTLCVAVEVDKVDPTIQGSTASIWNLLAKREEININLARCELLIEGIVNEDSMFNYDQHSLSLDSAIGPPQKFDDMPDSSSKTRHRVRTMIRKDPSDSSLWEMLGVYGIAETISAIEEHAVIPSVRNMIPATTDLKWVDVSFILEERRILLRYCATDEEGLGLKWTQEWWNF